MNRNHSNQYTAKPSIYVMQFICTLLLTSMMSDTSAQSILRLFSTPAERVALERERLRITRPDLVEEVPALPLQAIELPILLEEVEEVEIVYRLGGTMARNDGRYTVWLNNQAIYEEDLPANIELLEPYSSGQLRITNEESGQSFDVKPGQVLNLTTGVLVESYEYVSPPPATETTTDGETVVAPMIENLEASDPDNPESQEAVPVETGNSSTPSNPGVGVNATQLIDQARDLQDPGQ